MQRLNDQFPALCRLYAGGDALLSWYNSMNDPTSGLFKIAKNPDGGLALWIMGVVGAMIVLDVLINDWTPDTIKVGGKTWKISWKRAWDQRHYLFIVLTFCYAVQPYLADRGGFVVALPNFFYWNALQNLIIALFDAKHRSRGRNWQRACS